MKIPHYRELKQRTDSALKVARDPKRTILVYTAILTGLSLLVSLLSQFLDYKISGTGGLSNMSSRSVLSTIQSILPIAQTVILMGLEMGYIHATLRFARKQYADPGELKTGFRFFAPLLRMILLQTLIYSLILLAVTNLVVKAYLLLPFGQPLPDAITSMLDATGAFPLLAAIMAVFALLTVPLAYGYRMANYRLIDHTREGARAALRNSRRMMRGNRFRLFKVDLHFWWYYLLTFLASVICYGDQLLPLAGIELPISDTVAYFLFYAVYLAVQACLFILFRNRLEVTYATAYDAIRPQEDDGSVILGNIFDLARQ